MGCFINGLQALMIENNMSSVSVTANIDECGKMHVDTYEREYNPSYKSEFIEKAHKPSFEELKNMFI